MPVAPTNSSSAAQKASGWFQITSISGPAWACACAVISGIEKVPVAWKSRNMPSRKPKSPMRLTMKAFLPASALAFSRYQKPMRR